MAIEKVFCSALQKAQAIQKGTQINSKLLKNAASTKCISSVEKDLLKMGLNKADTEMLLRQSPNKNELLETIQCYDKVNARAQFLDIVRTEEAKQIELWGRPLNLGKNALVNDKDAIYQDIMTITQKHRAEQNFKKGLYKCKELPEDLKMTPEDRAIKAIIDKGFDTIPGTQYDMLQYRGEVLTGSTPYLKKLLSLKKGDIFEMPGYVWTTDCKKYAFNNYAGGSTIDIDAFKFLDRYALKYNILCPQGTKIMASRSRLGQEFVLPCDSKVRLVKKVIDENTDGRSIEIFCEHIPNNIDKII